MAWFKSGYKQTDTKDRTASFTQAGTRENIKSGENHKTIFGKIAKYFSDLKPVAFTGNYNDLQDKPLNLAPAAHKHSKSDITDFPDSLPASDVHAWAKATSKPSYSWNEIGSKPSSFTPVSHSHAWNDINSKPSVVDMVSNEGIPCVQVHKWCCISNTDTPDGGMNQVTIFTNGQLNGGIILGFYHSHAIKPIKDNNTRLGCETNRWMQVYAVNSAISTSDRNEKEEISYIGSKSSYEDTSITDEKLMQLIMGLRPVAFKRKGGESGRPHHGIIAQDFEKLMEDIGLHDHAAFIKSPKTKEIEITKEDGSKEIKIQEVQGEYIYGIRYEELISDVIRFSQIMYDRLDNLADIVQKQEEKITSLEEKLSHM